MFQRRDLRVPAALALAAVTGWGAFAYSAISSRTAVSLATAERDAAVTRHHRLQATVGDLREVEIKLGHARMQYTEAVQGWADARAKIGAAQQELAGLTKRVQQARDQVNQTGSIKPSESPKRPARGR